MPLLFLYFVLVLGVNLLHFLLYYYLSGAIINQYNLIFTGLFSIFSLWLITISAKKMWKLINILFVSFLAIYYTINFLFFKIFHEFFNFWKFSSFLSAKNFDFFIVYLRDAPVALYLLNIIWLIMMIVIIISYKPKYAYVEQLPGMSEWFISAWQKRIKKYYFLFTLVLGVSLFGINIAYQYYLTHKPADYWWQRSAQQQDFTLWGDFTYRAVFSPLENFLNKNFARASNVEVAEDLYVQAPSADSLNKLDLIKNNWRQLGKLNQQDLRRICFNQRRFEYPHVVFIQLESVPSWAIDQTTSIMPFLKNLKQDNLTVDHFFPNSCETINSEYASLCGFSVDSSGPVANKYSKGNFYCLPQILSDELNYQTNLYHANYPDFWSRDQLAPRWGFDNSYFSPQFEIRASDIKVLDKLADDLSQASQPTFNYFISFTSHSPHADLYLKKYNDSNFDYPDIPFFTLNDLPIRLKNSIELEDQTTNYYLSLLRAVDQSLEHFFIKLDDYGLLDNTIIFIYGDHRYYNFKPAHSLENFYNYNEVPFVMVLPGGSGEGGASVASHLDIAPTLLDLLNRSDLIPESFMGHSLFSNNFPNIAINKCLQEVSYVDENLIVRGNSFNQEYYVLHEFDKSVDENNYLKLISELNQLIDSYVPEYILGR